jgi:glycosyltransferase involved in cell wall biosynthesis
VVASRLKAVSDVYDDRVIEYFEPGDAADLARAIRRLHDDPSRRRELSQNGRLAEARSGWNVQQQTFLGVYEALLENERATPVAGNGSSDPQKG